MKIRAIATLLFILFSISAFGQGRAKISGISATRTVIRWTGQYPGQEHIKRDDE